MSRLPGRIRAIYGRYAQQQDRDDKQLSPRPPAAAPDCPFPVRHFASPMLVFATCTPRGPPRDGGFGIKKCMYAMLGLLLFTTHTTTQVHIGPARHRWVLLPRSLPTTCKVEGGKRRRIACRPSFLYLHAHVFHFIDDGHGFGQDLH